MSNKRQSGIFHIITGITLFVIIITGICLIEFKPDQERYDMAILSCVAFLAGVFLYIGVSEMEEYDREIDNIESTPDQILNDLQSLINKWK